MSTTNKAAVATAVATKIQKKLLQVNQGDWIWPSYAQKSGDYQREGDTVRKNRLIRVADVTSDMSEGAQYSDFTPKAMKTEKIETSIRQMADVFEFTDLVELTSVLKRQDMIDEIANQYMRSLSYQVAKEAATGCIRHRQDNDSTYEVNGTADSGSTTTLVDNALTQLDDAWNGGFCTIVNPTGTNYDVTRKVSDFVASSDTATIAAFNAAIDTTSKYHLCVGTNLASTDVFTIAALLRVRGTLMKTAAVSFDDGTFKMPLDAEIWQDIWSDTTFVNTATYVEANRYRKFELGRWLDVVFPKTSQVYREDTDGTENTSGTVHVPVCFGKNMFDVLHWGNASGKGGGSLKSAFAVHVYMLGWDDDVDSVNIVGSKRWVSWKANFATITDHATWGLGLMCGATNLPVVF